MRLTIVVTRLRLCAGYSVLWLIICFDRQVNFQIIASQTAISVGNGQDEPAIWRNKYQRANVSRCLSWVAFPVLFKMLEKRGNSYTEERIEILQRYIRLFGCEMIDCLSADREFVGEKRCYSP